MSYIDSNLQADEKVLDRTQLHWAIYLPPMIGLVGASILFIYWNWNAYEITWLNSMPGLIPAVFVMQDLIRRGIKRETTEIAITDRRIIYKTGLINRRTLEMNVDKVESVDVNQSVFGRLLGCGTIVVHGVGTGIEPLNMIADPMKFRDSVLSLTKQSGPAELLQAKPA